MAGRVASGSWDHTARVWGAETGATLSDLFEGHIDGVTSVVLSPDGKPIASGPRDQTVRIWDVRENSLFKSFHLML